VDTGHLKIKLQLRCGDSYAMGPGKADLLEAIKQEGSISAAGRALGMSYRRTWLLVDEMNNCFAEKLVETLSGGGRERGARVTDHGLTVLAAYRALQKQASAITRTSAYSELTRLLRATPRITESDDTPDQPSF
jgi:molybdate transport system regulatory protein